MRDLDSATKMCPVLVSAIAVILLGFAQVAAQVQIGTVRGAVIDQNNAAIQGANVRLEDPITGYLEVVRSDAQGEFRFNNLSFGVYSLRVTAAGFSPETMMLPVRSNVIVRQNIRLEIAAAVAEIDVEGVEVTLDAARTSTETRLGSQIIRSLPNVVQSDSLSRLLATVPGVTTQNNGLLHIRGVEDGILYVIDGVPTADRIDTISASSLDIDNIRSMKVITGGFPAEFGGRSAAVVMIQAESGIDADLHGFFSTSAGNFRTQDASGGISYGKSGRFGIYGFGAASRSDRFLAPVDERNFNNRGRRRSGGFRLDWHPSFQDLLFFDFRAASSVLRVTNDEIQEIAGQRQTQELRNVAASFSWQRAWTPTTATNLVGFRRSYTSELFPSPFDIPITATQDRGHTRTGLIGSYSILFRRHDLKFGFEGTQINMREFFSFAITDIDLADDREVSKAAQQFTPDNPFVFNDARRGSYFAAFAQTSFSPARNLSLGLGVRYERSSLPAVERQFSPRIAVAYYMPRSYTVIRASFNRLYQPPQLENLLLSDSDQARSLSPFLDETGGGARVSAERVSAYEVGVTQRIFRFARADVALWRRDFRNFGDPNTFFNTTIVFPNTVNKGFSQGLDLRLETAQYLGFSGYLSYTNGRILQIGPIVGGLFLTDEFIEIGDGTRFLPDHDQRNVGSFAVTYRQARGGWFLTFGGRHESGVPLEVEEDRLADLMNAPGADLVNFDRRRVRPWTVFDLQAGWQVRQNERTSMRLEFNVLNIFNKRFAYNFGSPFEGTHFGHRRMFGGRVTANFR